MSTALYAAFADGGGINNATIHLEAKGILLVLKH